MTLLKIFVISLWVFFCQGTGIADTTGNEFAIAPYLTHVDKDTATMGFQFKTPMGAMVRVYDQGIVRIFQSEAPAALHFITITGLEPGKTYNYQVVSKNGAVQTPADDNSYQIRTACNKGESFSFVVFGDPRPGDNLTNKYHQQIIDRIVLEEPAFSLVLGDMVDDGTDFEGWRAFFDTEKKLIRKAAIYPVMGDNDYKNGKGLVKEFFPILENGYYHFEWGDAQFFALNAWDSRGFQSKKEFNADSEQVKWLVSMLSQETVQQSAYRIVFLHDPVRISRGYPSQLLQNVLEPVFRKYNVDIVFASWHMYERSQNNGVRYIISGGGGAELLWMDKNPAYPSQAEAKKYHYCKVDVNAGSLTLSAIDVNNTILDSLSISPRKRHTEYRPDHKTIAEKVRQEIVINEDNGQPFLPIHLFSHDSCSYCRKVLKTVLPRLARFYQVSLHINYYDLELHQDVYDLFLAAGADFGHQNTALPAVFVGDQVLGGELAIEENLEYEISRFQENPEAYLANAIALFQASRDTKTIKEKTFDDISPGAVFYAGLIDGVIPCTMLAPLLLIAFMIGMSGTYRLFLISGAVFVGALMATYMINGLFFFRAARLLPDMQPVTTVLTWGLLLFVMLLACVRVWVYRQRHTDVPGMKGILNFFQGLLYKTGCALPVACLTGVIMSQTKQACISQTYMPIVTMIAEPWGRATAVGYLFLYSLAVVVPIILLYILLITGTIVKEKYVCR